MSNKTSIPEDRIPVIVGVGEIIDRPKEIAAGLEPLTLLEQALKRAEADTGGKLLGDIGSLDIVNFLSWRYRDPEKQLAERLGITPAHLLLRPGRRREPGPLSARSRATHRPRRMQRGRGLRRRGAVDRDQGRTRRHQLPWTPFAHDVEEPKRGAAFQKPMAVKLGVFRPITVYPFYEAAPRRIGARPRARRWPSPASCGRPIPSVASQNPNAWLKRRFTPEEITTPTPDNRLIAWPYTKLMVANPTVNMGAAILMTCLAKARAAGVAEDRLDSRLGRRLGGRAARLSGPRPVLRKPRAECRTEIRDGSGRRRRPRRSTRSNSTVAFPACRRWRGGRSGSAPTCSRPSPAA